MKIENKSISQLTKELDTVFSLFIRQRDSDEDGYGRCVTCGKLGHYKAMDCGHFVSRSYKSVRWNEYNCALQCKRCNGYGAGEQFLFGKAIDKRWGNGIAEGLQNSKHTEYKASKIELIELINHYKQLIY